MKTLKSKLAVILCGFFCVGLLTLVDVKRVNGNGSLPTNSLPASSPPETTVASVVPEATSAPSSEPASQDPPMRSREMEERNFAADSKSDVSSNGRVQNRASQLPPVASCCKGVIREVGDYAFPQMSTNVLSSVSGLSDEDLRLAINEMYARYGLTFKNSTIQRHFCARTWYRPDESITAIRVKQRMSHIERQNLALLIAERSSRG